MKPLKKAQQHNTEINKWMYTDYDLRFMVENREIFYFDEEHNPSYEPCFCETKDLRVWLDDMKEIKVVCREGRYMNVCVNQFGTEYYINL